MVLDPETYTRDELAKELTLLEKHLKEAPYLDLEFCIDCVHKHLLAIEGLAEEGIGFMPDAEKQLYIDLAAAARDWRKKLFSEPESSNPGEQVKPWAWTECEAAHPEVQAKIESCVIGVKERLPGWCLPERAWGETRPTGPGGEPETCYNPWAVCRESIRCP